MGYPKSRKEAVLKKTQPPNTKTIPQIAREEEISEVTLYEWCQAARALGGGCCRLAIRVPKAGWQLGMHSGQIGQ